MQATQQAPAIEKLFKAYREPSMADVQGGMDKAREAFSLWKIVPVKYRVKYLAALRRMLTDHSDEVARQVAKATGKVPVEALVGDIVPALEFLRYGERNAARLLEPRRIKTPFYFRNETAHLYRDPLGVVLVIAPANQPLQAALVPVAAALAAGNAVILKPDAATPSVGELVDLLCRRVRLPANLVQVLYGGDETVKRIVEARPDKIFFTGSAGAARNVLERAGREFIPVELNLNGKDAMIVFDDAQLERAVDGAAYGAFANAGLNRTAVQRLYVQDRVYEPFLKLLVQRTKELHAGAGIDDDIGSLVTGEQLAAVKDQVRDALGRGAKNITDIREDGRFYYPVVLKDADHSMKIMREETPGPVLPVMAFHDEAEAVRLANDSFYGLGASVWTDDLERGRRVAAQLAVGNCCINDVARNAFNPHLPFGGVKKSGTGRYYGPEGLYVFCAVRSLLINSGDTGGKEINWFPYSWDLYDTVKTFINLRFSDRPLSARFKGIRKALRFVNARERLW